MFEVVLIWFDGDKEIYSYSTQEKADRTCREMKNVFGNQISWIGVREVRR